MNVQPHCSGSFQNSDGMPSYCALRRCLESGTSIDPDAARVETKVVLPLKLRLNSNLRVAWCPNGNVVFHRSCWDQLLAECDSVEPPQRKRRRQEADANRAEIVKIREAEEVAEYHDSAESVTAAALKIADLVRKAKHCVFFTGAGLSTAAGIGDYRGKDGKWTEMDRQEREDLVEDEVKDEEGVPYEDLRPTLSHEVISKLIDDGRAQFVISQNCDDLHGLSGVQEARLAELHGNVFVERCEGCNRRYRRPYYVLDDSAIEFFELSARQRAKMKRGEEHWKQCSSCKLCHRTGRQCENEKCGQPLIDSIIHFGDDLEETVIASAEDAAAKADLVICLGSTISVTPASYIVQDCCKRKDCRVVICNRQRTDFDAEASVRVFGDCDRLSTAVLRELIGPERYSEWSKARKARMKGYDAIRSK